MGPHHNPTTTNTSTTSNGNQGTTATTRMIYGCGVAPSCVTTTPGGRCQSPCVPVCVCVFVFVLVSCVWAAFFFGLVGWGTNPLMSRHCQNHVNSCAGKGAPENGALLLGDTLSYPFWPSHKINVPKLPPSSFPPPRQVSCSFFWGVALCPQCLLLVLRALILGIFLSLPPDVCVAFFFLPTAPLPSTCFLLVFSHADLHERVTCNPSYCARIPPKLHLKKVCVYMHQTAYTFHLNCT